MSQENAQIVLDHHQRWMSREQWREFKTTESYQKFRLMAEGRMKELEVWEIEEMKKAAAEAWVLALDVARNVLSDEVVEASVKIEPELFQKLQESLAEKLLLEQSYLPPTYKYTVLCEQCGSAPAKKAEPKVVPSCVLCEGV